ncbi:antimicrobial peptide NK-lysin-like [Clupea harengus]|uniref:Antimicrobial peptide NK-lysin-like n=1 Tax=Clupea harengus TaxID=7950 RepID=A0A6P8GAX7_CLUHA|nr:antimicrobial peptide NK-lysin-like [Clupea harengus]
MEAIPGACKVCKWIIKKMRKSIHEGSTEEVIRESLEAVCNKTFMLKRVCRWFVKKYIDRLTKELSTSDDVRTICVNLKACRPRSLLDFM